MEGAGLDGGAAVTGYRVYQGSSKKPVASVTGTGTTVKNLANGTTYSFKVTAVNKAGEGPASGAASATPTAAVTKPGVPNGLTASPGNGQVTLSWKAPGSGGGTGISGYEVYRGTRPGGESGTPVNGSLVAGTSYTVNGLTNGTTYLLHRGRGQQGELQGAKVGRGLGDPDGRPAPRRGVRVGRASRARQRAGQPRSPARATATAAGSPREHRPG